LNEVVPTASGFWASFLPFGLPQRWPFCWWVAVVVDLYSRRLMGLAVYKQQPSSQSIRTFLATVMPQAKARPRQLITDHGG